MKEPGTTQRPATPQPAFGRTTAVLVGALFVLGIWLPLLDQTLGLLTPLPNYEKRELASRPSLLPPADAAAGEAPLTVLESLERFPRAYEAWYDDHFGLRSYLIRWHNVLKARLLRTPPNDEIVIGRDGWLYFAGQSNIEQYRALSPMPDALVEGWRRYLAIVREWAADHGAAFLLVIGPSKATIHPEHLPETIWPVGSDTRLAQFERALEGEGQQWLLDLTPALLAAKQSAPVYQKTDTHWNSWGSLVAVRALLDELRRDPRFASLAPLRLEDYHTEERVQQGGDIAELMGLTDLYLERDTIWEPRHPDRFTTGTEGLPPTIHTHHPPYLFRYAPGTAEPWVLRASALVFHDSFGPYLANFLPRFFEESAWYWQYQPSYEAMAALQPALVLQEVGERVLIRDELKGGDLPFPLDERIRVDFHARRAFRAASRSLFALQGSLPAGALLPAIEPLAAAEEALLRLDLVAAVAGEVRLEPGGPARALVAGRSVVYLAAPADGRARRLVFEAAAPDAAAGGLELRSAEARVVARGRRAEGDG